MLLGPCKLGKNNDTYIMKQKYKAYHGECGIRHQNLQEINRLEYLPGKHVPQEGPEKSTITKVLSYMLVRVVPELLRNSVATILFRLELMRKRCYCRTEDDSLANWRLALAVCLCKGRSMSHCSC